MIMFIHAIKQSTKPSVKISVISQMIPQKNNLTEQDFISQQTVVSNRYAVIKIIYEDITGLSRVI